MAASLLGAALAGPALAQNFFEPPPDGAPATDEPAHAFGVEAKAHYRDSEEAAFPVPFPFSSDQLPVGQSQGFLETVEPGQHTEVSIVTLWYRGHWDHDLAGKVKVDLIDRHDRNPTSTDEEWDVDEAWLRWGDEVEPGGVHDGWSAYAKLGKFPKFERQDDRHLESYGLVATATSRMEDVGLELGFDLGSIFYVKTSYTAGNPLYIRDPNALAGDNGTPIFRTQNPDPELGSGIVILYDADTALDDVNFDNPETGIGIGARFGDGTGLFAVDVLGWTYLRDLADTAEFDGTFYGGDLDLLLGPANSFPLDVTESDKVEWGLSLWVYAGGLSIFGQYMDQDIGGLPRDGFELEIAYEWQLPWFGSVFGRQLFPYIAPAVRYSEIEPEFTGHPNFPGVSIKWPWSKLDLGIRLGILDGLDLTLEYADNEFERPNSTDSADEFLATLRFEWDWQS